MSKPELSEDRIAEAREYADADMVNYGNKSVAWRTAQTTLALIESRKQALELLSEATGLIDDIYGPVMLVQLRRRIAAFLEQNQ